MFRKSRIRIVIATMVTLTLLWIITLSIILVASYRAVSTTNLEMLQEYVDMYTLERQGGIYTPGPPSPNMTGPHFFTKQFKLSTFYSVAVSYDGKVLAVDNDDSGIYVDSQLEEKALDILADKKKNGVSQNLVYFQADKEEYMLVAFMDNTVAKENLDTVFRYTLIIGGIAIVALFFLSVYLADRIVKPLEESHKKQKQFISDAGHELKTPVAVVNANVDLLSREIGDNQWISNIQYENERMSALITQLLDLARTENVMPQKEQLNLSTLVCGEVLPMESIAYENGLTLISNVQENIFTTGNGTQLKQLTAILTDNAIKHGIGGTEIVVSLKKDRHTAILSVINSGDEIPAEQRAHLFERFYRADSARTGEDKHYGLGLAIAKAIVEAHDGKIDVKCYSGKVEFIARLPL